MRLFLFRHGQVVHLDRFFGQFDNPLSEEGKRQSVAIADSVADLDLAAVYTSDLGRTAEVGRLITQRTGVPFVKEERLRELHLGWADGLPREEAFEREPELREAKYEDLVERPLTKGGETICELATRLRSFRDELVERHRGRKVVIIGHNTPNRVLIGDVLRLDLGGIFTFRQDFACLNVLEFGETRSRVALLNGGPARVGHLMDPSPDAKT